MPLAEIRRVRSPSMRSARSPTPPFTKITPPDEPPSWPFVSLTNHPEVFSASEHAATASSAASSGPRLRAAPALRAASDRLREATARIGAASESDGVLMGVRRLGTGEQNIG